MNRGLFGVLLAVVTVPLAVCSCSSEPSTGLATVASVVVVPDTATLYPGQSRTFKAVARTAGGDTVASVSAVWSSADTAVATVTAGGVVTAHLAGSTRIAASVSGVGGYATLAVRLVPVASLVVTPAGDTIGSRDSLQAVAVLRDGAGSVLTGRPIAWSSSDPAKATVSQTGLVVARDTGAVTISAVSEGKSGETQLLLLQCAATAILGSDGTALSVVLAAGLLPSTGGLNSQGFYHRATVLYGGGLIFGTSASDLVIGYNPADGSSELGTGKVCLMPATATRPYGARTWARVVSPVAGPPGLVVRQESISFGSSGDSSNFALLRYTFSNATAAAITGLSAGLSMDWDLSFDFSAIDDVARWNGTLGVGEAAESDSLTYPQIMTVAPRAASGTQRYKAWANIAGADPNRAGLFTILTASPDTTTVGPQDIRVLSGIGPLTVPAGGSVVVYFVIVGGDDRASFGRNLGAALARVSTLGF